MAGATSAFNFWWIDTAALNTTSNKPIPMNQIFDEPISMQQIFEQTIFDEPDFWWTNVDEPMLMNQLIDEHGSLLNRRAPLLNRAPFWWTRCWMNSVQWNGFIWTWHVQSNIPVILHPLPLKFCVATEKVFSHSRLQHPPSFNFTISAYLFDHSILVHPPFLNFHVSIWPKYSSAPSISPFLSIPTQPSILGQPQILHFHVPTQPKYLMHPQSFHFRVLTWPKFSNTPSVPSIPDNSRVFGIINKTVKQRRSKAMTCASVGSTSVKTQDQFVAHLRRGKD